jgi:hypothetical protein
MQTNTLSRRSQQRINKAIQLAARPTKTGDSVAYGRLNKGYKLQIVRG